MAVFILRIYAQLHISNRDVEVGKVSDTPERVPEMQDTPPCQCSYKTTGGDIDWKSIK